jgi:diguanylate cyclase (GGDEF)-like protein
MAGAADRYGHHFSVALFDVDRFKAYNDNFGHLAGDEMLRSIASVMVGHSRRHDTVYRYGGEELLVIFAEQSLDAAKIAAERMRAAIEAMPRPQLGGSRPEAITVSAGLAEFEPGDGSDLTRLLGRADEALYQAKELGRNRVVASSTTSAETSVPSESPATDQAGSVGALLLVELLLAHRALRDPLTGLPNRTLFIDRLTLELAQCERRATSAAVLFLDLDGFKSVNDRFGHDAGDRVLRAVAGRMLSSMRPGDTVARYGGDEFTILGAEIAHAEDVTAIAGRIAEAIMAPFTIEGEDVKLSASIGIAIADDLGRKAEEVIREADKAMYRAKHRDAPASAPLEPIS